MKQEVRFCTTKDGVRIAFATAGAGPVMIKAANWLSHLEFEWDSPIWRHWIEELTKDHLVIRYDERGNGLSDWNVDDLSFASWVRDLEAVVEAAGADRFALLGISQGGPVAIEYAVRHPERVTHLILYGTYARGFARRGASQEELEQRQAMLTLTQHGWGQNNPAFRQIWTTHFMPQATSTQMQWFNELQRISTSPENAVRILTEFSQIDVLDRLPQVAVPTLVLHCDDDAQVPFKAGREVAATIPGARFVTLHGKNHLMLETEPAWQEFLLAVGEFLGTGKSRLLRDKRPEAITEIVLSPGDWVGPYRVITPVGDGGMGIVFKAEDTRLGRLVALKFLSGRLAQNPQALVRFQREARAASALDHPNICTIHDIGEYEGQPFIVMQYLEGQTLRQRMDRDPLGIGDLLDLGVQIGWALAAAHAKGIVHRDIKPSNVFIIRESQVKLLDFGLAKMLGSVSGGGPDSVLSDLTVHGTVMGTVAYMSPEQTRGELLDPRTDVFSLGTVLYEAATGKLPFQGPSALSVMHEIAVKKPTLPCTVNPLLPQRFDEIIERTLAKDRDQRYPSGSEIAQELQALSNLVQPGD